MRLQSKFFKIFYLIYVVIVMLLMTQSVFASSTQDAINEACTKNPSSSFCEGVKNTNNPGCSGSGCFLGKVINILAYAAGAIAVFFVMYGGFKYIMSSGEANKAAEGRQTIIYALIGIAVVMMSRWILLYGVGLLTK